MSFTIDTKQPKSQFFGASRRTTVRNMGVHHIVRVVDVNRKVHSVLGSTRNSAIKVYVSPCIEGKIVRKY